MDYIVIIGGLINIFAFFDNKNKNKYVIDSREPQPAKGLILLISPYSRHSRQRDELLPLLEKIYQTSSEQLTQEDFDNIELLKSNLFPQIEAIKYHSQDRILKEVWLITTLTYQGTNLKTGELQDIEGSEKAGIILEKYLSFQYGNQLNIHRQEYEGKPLSIIEREYEKLWELVDHIFNQSDYKPSSMIADITGGTKRMSVALTMACLPVDRKIQYMDRWTDWQGNPLEVGDIQPIEIDVNSILEPDDEDS